jgi:hypothetical protein
VGPQSALLNVLECMLSHAEVMPLLSILLGLHNGKQEANKGVNTMQKAHFRELLCRKKTMCAFSGCQSSAEKDQSHLARERPLARNSSHATRNV